MVDCAKAEIIRKKELKERFQDRQKVPSKLKF